MKQYRKSYLVENPTSDNRSRARRYMRKESGMSKDESMQLDHQLQTQFKNVGNCECKFMLGLARMYMNGELEGTIGEEPNEKSIASVVEQCLGIVTEEPYASQFDYNLNGMTAMQLIDAFQDKVEAAGEADKEKLSKQDFGGNNGYDIVLIDSFEKAKEYSMYTDWCVTQSESAYNNYTKGGTFYFCLKKGFESIPKEVGPNTPLDEYGLSMIAVSIYPDGKCNTITCRWNHDNGGNDNVITTEELSKVIGENFYDVFKPVKRTITLGGREYVIGVTESGYKALYDEQGNNVLGDWVEDFWLKEDASKALGCKVYYVQAKMGANYILFKNRKAQYLFDEWFEWCDYYDRDIEHIDGVWFKLISNRKENFATIKDGKLHYLLDEWLDICEYDGEFSEYIGVPCFSIKSNGKQNFVTYRYGKTENVFDEWFGMCWYESWLSKLIGSACFRIEKGGKFNFATLKNKKPQYLFDEWVEWGDIENVVNNYLKQRNEWRTIHLTNVITEKVMRKLYYERRAGKPTNLFVG